MVDKLDYKALAEEVTKPISDALNYLKQGDRKNAEENIHKSKEGIEKYAWQMFNESMSNQLTSIYYDILSVESLLDVLPENIESANSLIHIRTAAYEAKSKIIYATDSEVNELADRLSRYDGLVQKDGQDISKILADYREKISDESEYMIEEIDRLLENYGAKTALLATSDQMENEIKDLIDRSSKIYYKK